jgi:hypothetical protein
MHRPEQIKSINQREDGSWTECTNRAECWHGCSEDHGEDCPNNKQKEGMAVEVEPNSDYSLFQYEAWARCLEDGGNNQVLMKLLQPYTHNGKMTFYQDGVKIKEGQFIGPQGPQDSQVSDEEIHEDDEVKIELKQEDTIITVTFEPIDRTQKAWAQVNLKADGVSSFTNTCMTTKFCMDKLADSIEGFEVRNSHHYQLMCLGPEDEIDAGLVEICKSWTKCMEQASEENMMFLAHLLIASSTDENGAEVSTLQINKTATTSKKEDSCFNPSLSDPERLECNCLESTKKSCEDYDGELHECIKEMMCAAGGICSDWKQSHCPQSTEADEAADIMLQRRAKIQTEAAANGAIGAVDGAVRGKTCSD